MKSVCDIILRISPENEFYQYEVLGSIFYTASAEFISAVVEAAEKHIVPTLKETDPVHGRLKYAVYVQKRQPRES